MCIEAVKVHGNALEYVPEKLKDSEMCLSAVKQYGSALYYEVYVPEKYRNDYEKCLLYNENNIKKKLKY